MSGHRKDVQHSGEPVLSAVGEKHVIVKCMAGTRNLNTRGKKVHAMQEVENKEDSSDPEAIVKVIYAKVPFIGGCVHC